MLNRLTWPKFGDAKKNTICWSFTDEVDIEITHPELKPQRKRADEYGIYLCMSQRFGWPVTDILQIREAPDAQSEKATFLQILKRRLNAVETEIQSKFASNLAAIEAEYNASMALIKEKYPPPPVAVHAVSSEVSAAVAIAIAVADPTATAIEEPDTAPKTTVSVNLGIRGRFNAKLAERKHKEDTAPVSNSASGTSGGGMGLSARMKHMKQDKQDTEQESTLFVSNIAEDSTENDLRMALNDKFNVRRINLVRKSATNAHSGVGFVVLSSREEADKCLEYLHGYRLNHLILSAAFSKRT